uniref:Tetraspanin n=1 Tax=Stegastes partitus TaxID=144197 RepID=A0A3B5B0Y3_9TELE
MAVEGGMKCVKFLLFFFNFIFWICGLALIVVGILVQVSVHNTFMINDASASGAPIVVIGIGVVIFFIAFFGCCGAWKENYCMVTTFAVLLSLIIIVELAAAIAGYVFRNKISTVVQDSLTEMITNYKNGTEEFRASVDKLQEDLKCCGVTNSSDWRSFAPDGNSVPDSCCVNVTANCGKGTMTDASKVNPDASILSFQIMGIVFACCLMRGIRSGYEVM